MVEMQGILSGLMTHCVLEKLKSHSEGDRIQISEGFGASKSYFIVMVKYMLSNVSCYTSCTLHQNFYIKGLVYMKQ